MTETGLGFILTPTTPNYSNSNSRVCWILMDCIALTGILYMGPGVPIPAESNSWVVVLLHGVGLWQTQEGS